MTFCFYVKGAICKNLLTKVIANCCSAQLASGPDRELRTPLAQELPTAVSWANGLACYLQ